jgi:glycine C-acetyltransferase
MSPIQAAVVRSSLKLIEGDEGVARRERLLRNVNRLRGSLTRLGYRILGRPSAVVPVIVGDVAYGRILTKHALKRGAIVNLVEYPAVSPKSSRLRLQVMADHTPDDLEEFVSILRAAEVDARHEYDSFAPPPLLDDEAPTESAIVPKAPRLPTGVASGG